MNHPVIYQKRGIWIKFPDWFVGLKIPKMPKMPKNSLGIIIAVLLLAAFTRPTKTETIRVVEYLKPDTVEVVKEVRVVDTVTIERAYVLTKPQKTPKLVTVQNIRESVNSRLYGYSPYEILIWHLTAHESFRPFEYPDGKYPSKGFGLNLTPSHVNWASSKLGFPARSRNWTYKEAKFLLASYVEEKIMPELRKKFPDKSDFQLVALAAHKYNRGNTRNIYACCNGRRGCGSSNRGIQDSHNRRREFEQKLWENRITKQDIEIERRKAIQVKVKSKMRFPKYVD